MSAKVLIVPFQPFSSIKLGRFLSLCSLFLGLALPASASAIALRAHRLNRSRKKLCFFIAIAAFILPGTLSPAQMVNLGDDLSRPIPGVGHDYIHMLNETVDPASGNLSFKIGLPVPKGRGLTIPLAITYNSGEVYRLCPTPGLDGMATQGPNAACGSGTYRTFNGWSDTFPTATMSAAMAPLYPYPNTNGSASGSGCPTTFSYTFYDPSGASHLLGLAAIGGVQGTGNYQTPNACANGITYNDPNCAFNPIVGGATCWGGYPYEVHSSGGDDQVQAQTDYCNGNYYPGNNSIPDDCYNGNPAFTVTDKGGTVYHFLGGAGFPYPAQIEDRNGNMVQVSNPAGASSLPLSMTDTLGRQTVVISGAPNSNIPTNYQVGGLNFGVAWGSEPTSLSLVPALSSQQILFPNMPSGQLNCNATVVSPLGGQGYPMTGIQAVTLPNGQQYSVQYDPVWGLPSQINYPDGGWVAYTWELSSGASTLGTFDAAYMNQAQGQGIVPPPPFYGGCNYVYQAPVIATRTVGYTPGVKAQVQQFTYLTCWNQSAANPSCRSNPDPNNPPNPNPYPNNTDPRMWQWKSTQVTTKDVITGQTSNTYYTYGYVLQPIQPDSQGQIQAQLPVEATIDYYDWNNKLLQTVTKSWGNQFEMGLDQTVLNNGQSSKTIYNYEIQYNSHFPGEIHQKIDYDFGQTTTPSRTTTYNYTPITEANNVIIFKPSQVIVSGSNPPAETDAFYDGASPAAVPGIQGCAFVPPTDITVCTHDETNYGPNSTTPRGNVTKVIQCLSGSGSTCSGPTTTYTYDETGQELSRTDPCGNTPCSDVTGSNFTTSYSYSDNYSIGYPGSNTNAYLTRITDPLGHIQKFSYNFNNGQLTAAQDQNDINANRPGTTYTYADPLNRLTLTQYPDGGQTAIAYNDAVPSVTTSTVATPDPTVTKVSVMDGVGHVIQTQLTSDPEGADTVNTAYDGEGRVYTETNPYRSTSDPTYGLTTHYYDALGRPIETQEQDGSILQWCYNGVASTPAVANCSKQLGSAATGTWIDSTDENGNHWQRTSDALGRLTEVMEPNGVSQTPTMETDYGYDVLNNLLSVNQWGGAYGSSGASGRLFSYDSLSRLLTANNPETGTVSYSYDYNGNLQNKTDARPVTTTYSYDALNRLTKKTYSDGTTLPVLYGYDTSNITIEATHVTASNVIGRLSWTCVLLPTACQSMTAFTYDPKGRTAGVWSSTPSSNTNEWVYGVWPLYDLAGNMIELNYPDGQTAAQTFDGAGRLGTVHYAGANYLAANSYDPAGHLTSATMGNGASISSSYNPREEIGSLAYGNGSSTFWSKQYAWTPNGNLQQASDMVTGITQQYGYDTLNRLTLAQDLLGGTPPTNGLYESYSYGPFGNIAESGSFTLYDTQYNYANRNYSVSYDAAGNVLRDLLQNRYTWDGDEMISSSNGVSYYYDGEGNRVSKSGSTPTDTVYFGGRPVTRYAGGVWTDLVYGTGGVLAEVSTAGAVYRMTDHLGSEVGTLSTTGALLNIQAYAPFGELFQGGAGTWGSIGDPYKFTGKERDAETGNDSFGARYYSSNMLRWLSPDWAAKASPVPYATFGDPQSLNLYSYVRNNPLSRADADGHCDWCWNVVGAVSIYVGSHPALAQAVEKLGASVGIKFSAGVGVKPINLGGVKLGAAASVTSETKIDGTGSSKLQGTVAASVNGIGVQGNGAAAFEKNGSLVNPLDNLSGNAKLTGSLPHGDNLSSSNAVVGTDDRIGVGVGMNVGVAQAGVQVTAGTQEVEGVASATGEAVVQDTKQFVQDLHTSTTCGSGGCAIPH
jgi:RHS repeat-associated protein